MSACIAPSSFPPSLDPSEALTAEPVLVPGAVSGAATALAGMPAPALAADAVPDSSLYLRLAQSAVAVDGPQALAQWWRGELQALLPHRALLVVPLHESSPSGLPQWLGDAPWRGEAAACALAAPLALAWSTAGHRPCRVTPADLPRAEGLGQGCWVHGLRGRRLFAFFDMQGPGGTAGAADATPRQALALLAPLLDAALRGAGVGTAASAVAGAANTPGSASLAGGPRAAGEGAWQAPASPPITMRRCAPGALSERERQIMAWVAQGKTNPEIGCILRISEFTVKNHLKSIFSKLDVTNRAQAVARMSRLALHA